MIRLYVAALFGRRYDRACRKSLTFLWDRVKASPGGDGCVMTNPLNGQLEGIGWTVYVQIGDRGQDFIGPTLLQAANRAIEETEDWVS